MGFPRMHRAQRPAGRSARTPRVLVALVAAALATTGPRPADGGCFIFASEANGVDLITHPTGYTGVEDSVSVSVCIDPASTFAAQMEIPVQNIVNTFNAMSPIQGNVVKPSPTLASNEIDFESVALHEVGHCIGLAHPNAASESGLTGADSDYTKATDGADDKFNLSSGADATRGSHDDVRGDDVNLHWFRISNNDPFSIATTVDSTTYARDTASLPSGDTFATNADRSVALLPRYDAGSTEAVMQQGSFFDEEQRQLNHDDVATLRFARAGLDSTAGSTDDYSVTLTYAGLTGSCDVVLDFDNSQTGFAVCQVGGELISAGHVRITSARAYFNTGFNWFFNDQLSGGGGCTTTDATYANQTVTGPISLEAENTVTLGQGLVINGVPGPVTVKASQAITVRDSTSFSGNVSLELLASPCD